MKVLHLISGGDTGGAKTHVFSLLGELKNIIDVRIVCFIKGSFYEEIKQKGVPAQLILQKNRFDLTVIKKLIKLIKAENYDIIHTHGARANFITWILKKFIKIPTVTTVHSDFLLDFQGNMYKRFVYTNLNILALKSMDYYIAVSNEFKRMLIERNYGKDNIFTVYNGIDFESSISYCPKKQFLKSKDIICNNDDILIGIIGRFDKVKGHEVFVNAAAKVIEQYKNVKFLLAGEGPEKDNLKNMAKDLGIEEYIFFVGYINNIFDFINVIDINTLTSYSESFPYALLEGTKMKKPTVSSAVGGIPDLIIDGQTGFLFKSGDYEQMAQKLLMFIKNKSLRKQLGENIYIRARDNFSNKSLAKRHIEIYKEILKKHNAKRG